ncbi:MAG: hypothetical protein J6U21_01355 [Bacteroidales bacterium]|nr:hypothetical protein [Bacteroidales bacterium]
MSNIPIKKTLSALDQIDDRDYIAATLDDDRRIVKLAIKFSSKDRNVEAYEAVEVGNYNVIKNG